MSIIQPSKEQNKRSAADIFAAFEYQWDYFVLMLLKENDEATTISFEFLDDVDVQTRDITRLCQIKHSVRKNTNGRTINLTNRDIDLWKTISIWMKIIDKQPNTLENSEFQLITNKTTSENLFLKAIEDYKNDKSIDKLKSILTNIKEREKTKKDDPISKGSGLDVSRIITELLGKNYLSEFCTRISILETSDTLKEEIKNVMSNRFALNPNRIDFVYSKLITKLREDAIERIQKGSSVSYNGSFFAKHCQSILDIGRKKLYFRTDYTIQDFCGEPRELLFMKQLFSVGDTKEDDLDRIVKLTTSWLCFNNNLQEHWDNADLIREDVDKLTNNICSTWYNHHYSNHRKITQNSTDDELEEAGYKTVDTMRNCLFSLADTSLESLLSEGCIYYYSNSATDIIPELPLIGWHRDWKNKFKNNE